MAFIGDLNEKLDQVEDRSYDPIPEGWYTAEIKAVDIKDTKDGTGKRMNIEFSVTGPEYVGRRVFAGLNIRNQNQKTEQFALQDLKSIRSSLGLVQMRDTDEMIGRALSIKVVIKPAADGYEAKNEIRGYKAIEGGKMPTPNAAPKPAGASLPPWAKKPAEPAATPDSPIF